MEDNPCITCPINKPSECYDDCPELKVDRLELICWRCGTKITDKGCNCKNTVTIGSGELTKLRTRIDQLTKENENAGFAMGECARHIHEIDQLTKENEKLNEHIHRIATNDLCEYLDKMDGLIAENEVFNEMVKSQNSALYDEIMNRLYGGAK